MKLQIAIALFASCAANGQVAGALGSGFEQLAVAPTPVWRTIGARTSVEVVPNGFVFTSGNSVKRMRWDGAMRLTQLAGELPLKSVSYSLNGLEPKGRILPRAERLRASSMRKDLSVTYYFGPRGLEFDVEVGPNQKCTEVILESVDGDVSVTPDGHASVVGEPLFLQPLAYQNEALGRRRPVTASWRKSGPRTLVLALGNYNHQKRLIVDPVMTYASYFAGSGDDEAFALRELPDGRLLLAGNTKSIDLPKGLPLSGEITDPVYILHQCFVARLAPLTKTIQFVSYFGGQGFTDCNSMDVDSQGRILLAGVTEGSPTLATASAQFPNVLYAADAFLARIVADGSSLDYSTYLHLDCGSERLSMRAGPNETAYISTTCRGFPSIGTGSPIAKTGSALLRYDIKGRSFDQQTIIGGGSWDPTGMEVSPLTGSVYVFGSTSSNSMLLRDPFQAEVPEVNATAGYVTAISPDFRTVQFGTYFGGRSQSLFAIHSLLLNADGSIWLAGVADAGSIPDLLPARPNQPNRPGGPSPFAVRIRPGTTGLLNGFLAGNSYGLLSPPSLQGLKLADGRYCLSALGDPTRATSGAAALGFGASVQMLACLNQDGTDLDFLTPVGTGAQSGVGPLASSQKGGVWSVTIHDRGGFGDVVPYDFKSASIEPFRPSADSDDLVLRYIDLTVPVPVLVNPQPVTLLAVKGNYVSSVTLTGKNFALGMQLDLNGSSMPLTVTGPTVASLSYKSPLLTGFSGAAFKVPAGIYPARLTIAASNQLVASEPFSVAVQNLKPSPQPFSATRDPRTFTVASPVYGDSQVFWNGQPLVLRSIESSDEMQVQIPAELSPPGSSGELVLINQRPGGGVQRAGISIGNATSSIVKPSDATKPGIPALAYQADKSNKLLYTVTSLNSMQWEVSSRSLPDARLVQSVSIPKNGATQILDFKLSANGELLYLFDDLLRVHRFQARELLKDLEFTTPQETTAPSSNNSYQRLFVLDDAPESIVIATPAGRLIIYDHDVARPYTTSDFPSQITVLDPVLTTSSYVYALQRPDVYKQVPCLARYSIDSSGFGLVEDFCNPGANWGKYPEMKVFAGNLFLENDVRIYGIRLQPDTFGNMRASVNYDKNQRVGTYAETGSFSVNTRSTRLLLTNLDTGELIGHYPAKEFFTASIVGPSLLVDDTLLVFENFNIGGSAVIIVPQWPAAIERYP